MNLVIKQEGGGGGGNLIPLLNHGAATVLVFKGLQCIFEYLHIFSEIQVNMVFDCEALSSWFSSED